MKRKSGKSSRSERSRRSSRSRKNAKQPRFASTRLAFKRVLNELSGTLPRIGDEEAERFMRELLGAKRVYLAGMGRSGLVASAFAMRLVHLGFDCHVVGESTAPSLTYGDLLVVASCTGTTRTTIAQANATKVAGARVTCITAARHSPLASASDLLVLLDVGLEPRRSGPGKLASDQFGGTLFEQELLLYLDSIVLVLTDFLPDSSRTMNIRHQNLE